jgi:hypothetical protein
VYILVRPCRRHQLSSIYRYHSNIAISLQSGTLDFVPPLALAATEAALKPQASHMKLLDLSSNEVWIKYELEKLLELTSGYQQPCSVVSGEAIGIGVGSGRVWMC